LPDLFLPGGIQVVDADRQFAPHVVEQHFGNFHSRFCVGRGQCRMRSAPQLRCCTGFIEGLIFDFEQSALLKVWRRDAPAPLEVAVESVADHFSERPLGISQRLKLHVRVVSIQVQWQLEGLKDA
jgi:hypothetical protein